VPLSRGREKVEVRGIPHLAKNERDMGHPTIRGRVKDRMGHPFGQPWLKVTQDVVLVRVRETEGTAETCPPVFSHIAFLACSSPKASSAVTPGLDFSPIHG
jgi:hypothetical protein